MDSKLCCKIFQGEEGVAGVETFLVFPVAVLHFAIVAGCIGTDQLVPDSQLSGGTLK